MKILWHGSSIEAPCYSVPPGARLVAVDATRPLARVANASGRVLRSPRRKALRFLVTDGPRETYRKARTKLGEARFSGDYRIVALVGTLHGSGDRVVALACRVPPAAEYMLVHDALAHAVDDSFSGAELERFAARVADELPALERIGHQSFLYSGEDPPRELVDVVRRSAASASSGARLSRPDERELIEIPRRDAAPADPVLRRAPLDVAPGQVPVAVLGAGDYARTQILRALERPDVARVALADREPQIAALAATEAGFALATTDARRAVDALPGPGVVFVATYHDSHAALAAYALSSGHGVFLEKPPVVTEEDLDVLLSAAVRADRRLAVGFNRRYNTLVRRARDLLAAEMGPFTITCVVREVALEPTHWYLWPNQGTRVTGNLCHWIDLGVFLMGGHALPVTVTVSPAVSERPERVDEERSLSVTFDDGSLLTIVATGRGDDIRGVQELVEARRGGLTVTLDDLWKLRALRNGRERRDRTVWRDKGHARMFRETLDRLAARGPSAYPLRDLALVSIVQIAASRLVRESDVTAAVEESARGWLERVADAAPAHAAPAASRAG